MRLELLPPYGVPPVWIGMPRLEARNAMAPWGDPIPFSRHGEPPGWRIYPPGIFVYMGLDECVDCLEFASPGYGEPGICEMVFRGIDVFLTPAAEVLARLRAMGFAVEDDGLNGPVIPELLLSFWLDGGPTDSRDEPLYFEAVLVARPGYYHAEAPKTLDEALRDML